MAELDPFEANYFRTKRRQVTDTYNLGQVQNEYQQGALGRQYGRNVGTVTQQFDRMREKMPWGYAARGVMDSGIWARGLKRYGEDRNTAITNMAGEYQDQLGALQLSAQQLGQVKTGAISDIEEAERARIASIAAMLREAGLG